MRESSIVEPELMMPGSVPEVAATGKKLRAVSARV